MWVCLVCVILERIKLQIYLSSVAKKSILGKKKNQFFRTKNQFSWKINIIPHLFLFNYTRQHIITFLIYFSFFKLSSFYFYLLYFSGLNQTHPKRMEKKKKKKGFGLGCRASVHNALAKRRLGLRLTEIVVLVNVV